MTQPPGETDRTRSWRPVSRAACPLLMAAFLIVWFRTAWVCDDAYITFRTIDNLWRGFGLVFNVGERVQGYTHPLWMAAIALPYGLTSSPYAISLVLSACCTIAALLVLVRSVARTHIQACLAVLLLGLSRAFVDYSSSGLENPLTHLLTALFIAWWSRMTGHTPTRVGGRDTGWSVGSEHGHDAGPGDPSGEASGKQPRRDIGILFLLASLMILTRPDTVWMVGPVLVAALVPRGLYRGGLYAALGLLPVAGWGLFSFFYYGLPIPNTALAKLSTGIPTSLLLAHGGRYFLDSLTRDPLTLLTVGTAIGWTFASGNRWRLPLGAGLLLHLAYVAWIGGDFMSGRFFSVPFLAAVAILASAPHLRLPTHPLRIGILVSSLVLLGLIGGTPTFLSGSTHGRDVSGEATGIADERARYYPTTGLLRAGGAFRSPTHPWVEDGLRLREEAARKGRQVVLRFAIGMTGYHAGPDVHIVDVHALTDPLLARLYCNQREGGFRIGHFARWIPGGYLDTLRLGRNMITQPDLARFYDRLALVIRGPLLDLERVETALKMELGLYDTWLDAYRDPPRREIPFDRVAHTPPPDRTRWDAAGNILLSRRGLVIRLPEVVKATRIEVSLDRNDDYRIRFLRGDRVVGATKVVRLERVHRGLATRMVAVPETARKGGFDGVEVTPVAGDLAWSLGHLRLVKEPSP